MTTYRVLPLAREDIRHAFDYIRARNETAAVRFLDVLAKTFDRLAMRPETGRQSPDLDIREWSIPGWPYVIPYRVNNAEVEILRVWHTSRRQSGQW